MPRLFKTENSANMTDAIRPALALSIWIIIPAIIVVAVLLFWFLIWKFNLPFVGRIFWKILPTIVVLVVAGFWIAVKFFDYEMTNADYGGSTISAIIFSYLLHLWMLPGEFHAEDAEPEGDVDLPADDEETL